jgi:hypothetical protein
MKTRKLFLMLFTILMTASLFAQAPQKVNYQAVCRDNAGNIIAAQPVDLRITIQDQNPGGTSLYQETHSLVTNNFGLVNIAVGGGVVISGSFSSINWGSGDKYIHIELNDGGGFVAVGTPQLLSVPYALYANAAGSGAQGPTGPTGNQGLTGAPGPAGANGPTGPAGPTGLDGQSGDIYATSSVTSLAIITGTKNLIVATGLAYTAGQSIVIAYDVNNKMEGSVVSYNPLTGAMEASITSVTGSGTYASWGVNLNGTPGIQGPAGPTGAPGAAGADGLPGPMGVTGPSGSPGLVGPTGLPGANGPTGPAGPTGTPGTAGANGTTGPTGPAGPQWTITSDNFNASGTLSIVTSIPSTITSTNAAWITTGNSGTSPSSNFIGTTDAQPLIIKTSGAGVSNERVRFLSNPQILINGTTVQSGDLLSVYGSGYTGALNTVANQTDYPISGYSTGAFSGIYGENTGNGSGVIGINANNGIGLQGLALNTAVGTYGAHYDGLNLDRMGYFGAEDCGGYAQYNANVAVWLGDEFNDAVYGINVAGINGSDYGINAQAAIWGEGANNTATYSFGVVGRKLGTTNIRSGGVLGGLTTTTWGALGYRNSGGTNYAAYFTSPAATGTGYMAQGNSVHGIGLGSYGGTMGGWVRGEVLGFTAAGSLYASYNLGNTYTSGISADIVTAGEKRMAAYSVTSPEVQVYGSGTAKLHAGQARVDFTEAFKGLVSSEHNPVITVTPVGNCNGLHLVSVDHEGFVVAENGNGTASVAFNWIAIGHRVDVEGTPVFPEDIANSKFDDHLRSVMFNENNAERSASPIWWDGSRLRYDNIPAGEQSVSQPVRKQRMDMNKRVAFPEQKIRRIQEGKQDK